MSVTEPDTGWFLSAYVNLIVIENDEPWEATTRQVTTSSPPETDRPEQRTPAPVTPMNRTLLALTTTWSADRGVTA